MKDLILSPLCDELGSLEKEFAPHKPKLDRIEMLRKALRLAVESRVTATEGMVLEGERFDYIVGPRGRERQVSSMSKLFALFGKREFMKRCKMATKHLEELGIGLELLVWKNLGPRSLKCVEHAEPVPSVSAIADATAAIEANAKRAKRAA